MSVPVVRLVYRPGRGSGLEDSYRKAGRELKRHAVDDDSVREAVMSFMHYNGANAKVLSLDDWVRVYLRGDGFGPVSLERASKELEWDWSHVRDSSPEGVAAMWREIVLIMARKRGA